MKEAVKLSVALAVICALAASVLAYANWKTDGPRKAAELKERQAALKLVLPRFANNPIGEAVTIDGVTYYPAKDAEGKLLAFAGEGSSQKGFGGNIQALVGLSPAGEILTVIVTKHKETPGLGTQVTDRKQLKMIWDVFKCKKSGAADTSLPPCRYLDGYTGKAAAVVGSDAFRVVKSKDEVDDSTILAVSGATVSSNAVADAVAGICRTFAGSRETLVQ